MKPSDALGTLKRLHDAAGVVRLTDASYANACGLTFALFSSAGEALDVFERVLDIATSEEPARVKIEMRDGVPHVTAPDGVEIELDDGQGAHFIAPSATGGTKGAA